MKKIDSWLHIQRYLTEAASIRQADTDDAEHVGAEEEPAHTTAYLEINNAHI